MAFKMRSNPMKRNFGSALKHYRGEDGKVLGVHGHKSNDGDITYHGESRTTGTKSTYDVKPGEKGVERLVKNPNSSFGRNKRDE